MEHNVLYTFNDLVTWFLLLIYSPDWGVEDEHRLINNIFAFHIFVL